MKYFITIILIQNILVTFCQGPIADFQVNVIYKCGFATTEFKNTSVNADTFLWDIDGTGYFYQVFEPRGSNIGINKNWIVTMIAKGQGLSDTLLREVEVLNTKIKFDKSINDTNSFAPLQVDFINQSVIRPGDTLSYYWDFGDSQYSNETAPQHSYSVSGTFYINLTAIKKDGCELSYHDFITIRDTAQKDEFDYIISDCSTKPCDFKRPHIYEMSNLILNQLIERNDSFLLSGMILQNCCTKKTVTLSQKSDTIFIQTWEVGPTCTCDDLYYFEIYLPKTDNDSIILSFNNIVITTMFTDISTVKNNNFEISIYPNPVDDLLTFNLPNSNMIDYEYYILDMQGKMIQKGEMHNESYIRLIFPDNGVFIICIKNKNDKREYVSKFEKINFSEH